MRIAVIWWWDRAQEILPNWRDGLRAAIEELSKTNQVDFFLGEIEPLDEYDFTLLWGDSNCTGIDKIANHKGKKGIILTTDPHNIENLKKLDVVYCESTPIYEAVRSQGIRAVKAFGTDSDFYTPDWLVNKDIDYFYPATFSPWKLQSNIAHLGEKLLCVGTVQPDGNAELDACHKTGVNIMEGYFTPEEIKNYYNRACFVPIPAIHGSERTCLEAMSMNILPSVNPNNKRTLSFIEEYIHSEFIRPRDFILANYSPQIYAQNILKGI